MGGAQSHPQPKPRARVVHQKHMEDELNEKAVALDLYSSSRPSKTVLGNARSISASKAQQYVEELLQDPKNRLGLSALSTNNMNTVLERPSTILKDSQIFNLAIPSEGSPVTNQRSSGRCWIFAATNVFRITIMKKYKIEQFELSQAYLFFWDKFEKANYFLETILELAETHDVDSRLVVEMNKAPINDGGQWDMIVNLVSKYGIVPQTLYPDSWNAMNSAAMDRLITTKLREAGLHLRKMQTESSKHSITEYKDSVMQDIIRILTLCLGPPPSANEKFSWKFYNKSKELATVEMTPLQFAATTNVTKFVSLVNDPRHEYMRLMTVANLGNVYGARPVTYINVDMKTIRRACFRMLSDGKPVWFGSDVGKQSDSAKGIMDTNLVDYELGFNVKLNLTKAQRLMTGESAMTHAMVLTAVHVTVDGEFIRWRVENSWSENAGTKGYFVMSDDWMDQFFYQAVVDPAILDKDILDVLKQEPLVLNLWDPMGALA